MSAAYEDNFGFWDIDGPEERAFFEHVSGARIVIHSAVVEVARYSPALATMIKRGGRESYPA
jgi:hypothetical protein